MMENTKPKSSSGGIIKILLALTFLIFLSIGGYSVYRYFMTPINDDSRLVSPTPTIFLTADVNPTSTPIPTVQIPTITPAATIRPTIVPTVTPTSSVTPIVTPSPTAVPTRQVTPTVSQSPSPTPTKVPSSLPVAGNSTPTILMFVFGILLLLPALIFRKY